MRSGVADRDNVGARTWRGLARMGRADARVLALWLSVGCAKNLGMESASIESVPAGAVVLDCVVPLPAQVATWTAPATVAYPDGALWVFASVTLADGSRAPGAAVRLASADGACGRRSPRQLRLRRGRHRPPARLPAAPSCSRAAPWLEQRRARHRLRRPPDLRGRDRARRGRGVPEREWLAIARVMNDFFLPDRSSYRLGPGVDLHVRYVAWSRVHPFVSGCGEYLFGTERAGLGYPDPYLVRGLLGIALPSAVGDLRCSPRARPRPPQGARGVHPRGDAGVRGCGWRSERCPGRDSEAASMSHGPARCSSDVIRLEPVSVAPALDGPIMKMAPGTARPIRREYVRHWTPIHLDFSWTTSTRQWSVPLQREDGSTAKSCETRIAPTPQTFRIRRGTESTLSSAMKVGITRWRPKALPNQGVTGGVTGRRSPRSLRSLGCSPLNPRSLGG
jgi:hypothetical protein